MICIKKFFKKKKGIILSQIQKKFTDVNFVMSLVGQKGQKDSHASNIFAQIAKKMMKTNMFVKRKVT